MMKQPEKPTPEEVMSTNKFCKSGDLGNEASVESFFVLRLLSALGYEDSEIKTKASIESLKIPRGRKRENYKPDYIISCRKSPRWLIDAKGVGERIENYTYQCAGYALLINRKYRDRPCRFYMLTNGLLTRVYAWDQEDPILSLRFADFSDGNPRYETLKRLLGAEVVRGGWEESGDSQAISGLKMDRPNMDIVKKAFLRCHRIIWKSEKMSPQAAFIEFAKLMFVKLWEDRALRSDPNLLALIGKGEKLPTDRIRFSNHWIEQQEAGGVINPVSDILFRNLVERLEEEIAQKKRKRIFETQERLRLSPGTTKRVVQQLENFYLFGIDEDLNGRMFEAFLAAIMRGKSLGQYFTPRSVTKLMVRLADLKATSQKDGIERVLDACCGTGGFLIEALSIMRRQIWNNTSLSESRRNELLDRVANNAIFGIDAGTDPMVARIARINMYLHGDGGSRVYCTDALRIPPEPSPSDTAEMKEEVRELRQLIEKGPPFDAVLTNPPFSMDYSDKVPEEKEILEKYELTTYGGTRRASLRSAVLFMERYWQLLRPGGRLLTVIDDSVLSGRKMAFVRNFIREKFIIRAIISLHGDAFQRAGARTKTSILYLTKRNQSDQSQPDPFVFESRFIGLDDVVSKTPASVAELARSNAIQEIDDIISSFQAYQDGQAGPWLVPASLLMDRLDAKYLRPWSAATLVSQWKKAGATSEVLENLVDPIFDPIEIDPAKEYTFIRVTYSGDCERGEKRLGREITYSKVNNAKVGDIVVSGMGAVYRALCVIQPGMEDLLISHEFTILRLKPEAKVDPWYLWSVLRSAAIVAEWLSGALGLARHRIDWEILKKQLVPLFPYPKQKQIGDFYRKALKLQHAAENHIELALKSTASLDLEGEAARDKLERAKPPR